MSRGPNGAAVVVCDLGAWGAASLLSEYDPGDDAIRVNARAVERVRAMLGALAAEQFVACAVAHERFHREHPGCSEAEAHAFARATCGEDPKVFERALRAPQPVSR
jgi:hypothetical protein